MLQTNSVVVLAPLHDLVMEEMVDGEQMWINVKASLVMVMALVGAAPHSMHITQKWVEMEPLGICDYTIKLILIKILCKNRIFFYCIL